jgi:hypothetical protein
MCCLRVLVVQVRAVLLDPSCSGSGTEVVRGDMLIRSAEREDRLVTDNSNTEEVRLRGLVHFQVRANEVVCPPSKVVCEQMDRLMLSLLRTVFRTSPPSPIS